MLVENVQAISDRCGWITLVGQVIKCRWMQPQRRVKCRCGSGEFDVAQRAKYVAADNGCRELVCQGWLRD